MQHIRGADIHYINIGITNELFIVSIVLWYPELIRCGLGSLRSPRNDSNDLEPGDLLKSWDVNHSRPESCSYDAYSNHRPLLFMKPVPVLLSESIGQLEG